jgi:DNA-directed RNA polymerase specialized sigma24 family protein
VVKPLEAIDEELIKWRGVARAVATRLLRQFPRCVYEDLEAACWVGVHKGLAGYRPELGVPIKNYLCRCAAHAGIREAQNWCKNGVTYAPTGGYLETVGVTEVLAESLAARARLPVEWTEAEWARVLFALPPKSAEVVRLRLVEEWDDRAIAELLGYAGSQSVSAIFCQAMDRLYSDEFLRELARE